MAEVVSDVREQAVVVEVGPRDGLQYENVFFPTDKKIELVDLLSESGLKRIEVSSFVHPSVIPHLGDAVEVLQAITKKQGVVYSALVPNLKGLHRALDTPVDEIALFVSASEAHNQRNVGMSITESLKGFREISRVALKAGKSLRGYVATAFGCPYEGAVSKERVRDIALTYADCGVSEISLGDTTGMANPIQVLDMMSYLVPTLPSIRLAVHFHNSRGLGMANAFAALQAGIRIFDSSVGGLGGCPTAVGAMGNIPTEDLVNMLEEMGVSTGIDFDRLLMASTLVKEVLKTELPSFTFKQGRPEWRGTEE